MSLTFFPISSDVGVMWTGLADHVTGSYINDATVTGVLTDATGATVESITLNYVAASNGNYRGQLSDANSMTLHAYYTLTVTAISGDLKRVKRVSMPARYDGADDV